MDRIFGGVQRFLAGWTWLKVVVWTVFAAVGPVAFLLMQNYLGVALVGAISLGFGVFLFGPKQMDFHFRGALRGFLVAQGVLLCAYGSYVLATPSTPWRHGAGRTQVGLALSGTHDVYAVEFTETAGRFYMRRTDGQYEAEPFPGHLALDVGVARDGTVFVHEDRTDALHVRGPDGVFRLRIAEGNYATYAPSGDALFIASRGTLLRAAPPFDAEAEVAGVGPITTVCSVGKRVLAVRSSTAVEGEGRAWESTDGGETFRERSRTSLPATRCALSEDGYTWLTNDGIFEGDIAVARGQGAFERVRAPAPRIEAIAVNPRRGTEAWLGIWGAGVYRTEDAGRTWTHMGLRGFEVSALAIDFERRTAYAGTGSGLYEREF